MRRGVLHVGTEDVPLIQSRVCVVGSGAAALNTAVHLGRLGVKDVVIVTERLGGGTSANAGSDKQTYCRVNSAAAGGDGVMEMALELFSGGAMHGDIALVEAALSEREFYHLVELGVPFPHDRYGTYSGYRTDHDSKGRGTSAGPRTSTMMFERLLDEVVREKVPIIDGVTVIELITDSGDRPRVSGVVGLEHSRVGRDDAFGLIAVLSDFVVYAVGGPGGLYRDSVYPETQIGGLGAPLAAGAAAVNLTESQFGIASVGFRWNLSGSYQQVLPRYISTDGEGGGEREFLNDGYPDPDRLFAAQFLKGYQWPFDVRKVSDFGSSLIDLLVFDEIVNKGRCVFLDFTQGPSYGGTPFSVRSAPDVVREYLAASGAVDDTPVERLRRLNEPAYDLFLDNGIDLSMDRVPIAVCHQHVNGGLAGSLWWETTIQNLFAVGEANGSHGIYRPGGAALNAGQVGSLRAAQMIAHRIENEKTNDRPGRQALQSALERLTGRFQDIFHTRPHIDPDGERAQIRRRMSAAMGIVRSAPKIAEALLENQRMMEIHRSGGLADRAELAAFVRNDDLLITERAFLASAKLLLDALSGPRGSYVVTKAGALTDVGARARKKAMDIIPDESLNDRVVQCRLGDYLCVHTELIPVRPIPKDQIWFETVWADYREGAVFDEKPGEGR